MCVCEQSMYNKSVDVYFWDFTTEVKVTEALYSRLDKSDEEQFVKKSHPVTHIMTYIVDCSQLEILALLIIGGTKI